MPKIIIALALATGLTAVTFVNLSSKSLQAASEPLSSCAIPKNYGIVKATTGTALVFEASDGTIRFVSTRASCPVEQVIARN